MEVFDDPFQFQAFCAALESSRALGFVPTMGALHAGHLALVQASRRQDAVTAVSIFVNPTQFAPGEDYQRYPRALDRDCSLLHQAGVQAVFAPVAEDLYLPGDSTRIDVEGLSDRLCGASRPGHFRGVATVVLKLFQLAAPTRAYFGQKDAAQVAVIRRLVLDLFLPVELVICPIVREPDGLALSSRNMYLDDSQRRAARVLSRALRRIGDAYDAGERSTAALLPIGRELIGAESSVRLDYLSAVDASTLLPCTEAAPGTLIAVAAFVGSTRLIDNAQVDQSGVYRL